MSFIGKRGACRALLIRVGTYAQLYSSFAKCEGMFPLENG